MHILVTGGAGFIGSFLVDALVEKGHRVRIVDNLDVQVHQGRKPVYLNQKAEFMYGDVRSRDTWMHALDGMDVVFHLASKVGVGQSNYEMKEYCDVNIGGMANLLHIVANQKRRVGKIVMTASMTSYGEGTYRCGQCGVVRPAIRIGMVKKPRRWDPPCPVCGGSLTAIATSESALIDNNSVYALTKRTQEEMLLLVGKLYGIPVVSLRCFNVYGPRQSLSNPYTGVSAIFISRLKNNQPPIVYEDGLQTRDFVSVHDVVDALINAMELDKANGEVFNIGSGSPMKIVDIAQMLAKLLKKEIAPIISYQFRKNDIRHCFADITKAKRLLGWRPRASLREGLKELIVWSRGENAIDLFEQAEQELRSKALV